MKRQDTADADQATNQAPPRKPYEKPRLEVYGDLTAISKSNFGSKQSDGSAHPNKHFTS